MKIYKNFRLFLLLLHFFHSFCQTVNNGCAYCYPPCRLGVCGQYIQEFYNLNPTQCEKCAPQCRTCLVSDSQCYSCRDLNHISHNSQCFCKPGYLELIGSCIKCEIPCFACKVNPFSCTECLDVNANVISDQCKCKDGMYFDNFYTCQICDNNCKTCQQQFLCITCYQYFYLDIVTNKCIDCPSPCLDCIDSQNCKSCIEGYFLFQSQCTACQEGCLICDAQQCLLCDDNYLLINQQCEQCQESCSSCQNSSSYCLTCIDNLKVVKNGNCECYSGYYEDYTQCVECQYQCEICQDQNYCKKCFDLKNLFLKDGKCICEDGYYFNQAFCQVCDQNCQTCDQSPNYCNSCDSLNFRQLDKSIMRCACIEGYFENNQVCQQCNNIDGTLTQECAYQNCGDNIWTYGEQCDDGNNLNRDGCSNCQIDQGYFCQNTINQTSICNKCQLNCLQCLSQNECPICMTGYFRVDGYCVQCQQGCNDCISYNQCLTCQYLIQGSQCKQCHQVEGYYLIDGLCQSICGDGIQVQNEQCDDGNIINNDGCDQNCQIEDGYTYKNNQPIKMYYPNLKIVSIDTNLYNSIKQFELTYDQPLKYNQFNWIFDISISINNLTQGVDYIPIIIDQSSQEQSMLKVNLKILLVLNNKSLYGDQIIINFFDPKKFINIEGVSQKITQVQCKISNQQYIDEVTQQQTQQAIICNQYLLYVLLILVLSSIFFGGMEAYNNLLDLIQLVSYLQYVNTQLPYNYLTYLELFQFAQFSFFNQYVSLEQYYIGYIDQSRLETINQKFSQDGYYSNAILNLHSILNVWVLIFIIYFFSLMLPKLLHQIKIIIKIQDSQSMITLKAFLIQFKKIIFKTSYNLNHQFFYSAIIRTFMAIFYDLSFIILINLSTLNFKDPYYLNNLGSLVTVIFCSLYFLVFIFFFRTLRNKKHVLLRFQNQYGPLFEGLKLRNQKYYIVYVLIKKLYFMTSVVLLFKNPLYQIINMTFASLLQIAFIIAKQPLLNKLEQLKQVLCEIQMFLIQILISFLVLDDQENQLTYELRQNIGWACILLTSLMLITQIIFDIIIQWKEYVKQIKQFKRKIFQIFNIDRNDYKQKEINILDPLRQLF